MCVCVCVCVSRVGSPDTLPAPPTVQGVECFAYDSDLTVLATGGMDHAVRLWNPYVTSKPIAYLQQHNTTILDLVIYRELGLLFSYSQDGVGGQ